MLVLLLLACNPDPGQPDQGVGYRDPQDTDYQSGERGDVVITEILWSGSVNGDGVWDPTDVFIEIRNQGEVPLDLTGWRIEQSGTIATEYQIPAGGPIVDVGAHVFVAAKSTGCFDAPDWVIPELRFSYGDPFELTIRDFDERLIEPSGDEEMRPFAGGYDGVKSRSMERVELMFGGRGTEPHQWHFYTDAEVDVPNDDRVVESCRTATGASPGRANSPDYSGAYASGSFE